MVVQAVVTNIFIRNNVHRKNPELWKTALIFMGKNYTVLYVIKYVCCSVLFTNILYQQNLTPMFTSDTFFLADVGVYRQLIV